MTGKSSSALFLFTAAAAAIVACSQLAAGYVNESEEFDLSPASPFESFMTERESGCKRDKFCAKKGGKCVEAGTCQTVEIKEMCHKKNGDACTCCAKDKKAQCKRSKTCREVGGFCVIKKKACKNGMILKKDCRCKGVWGKRGYCCVGKPASGCSDAGGTPFSYNGEIFCAKKSCANWTETREWCQSIEGMAIAQPKDPKGIAHYINSISMGAWYWLGGKGDGYNQIWLNGTSISNDSSLWSPFQTFRTDVNYCMMLNSARNLDTPLETYIISDSCGYRLCQGATSSSRFMKPQQDISTSNNDNDKTRKSTTDNNKDNNNHNENNNNEIINNFKSLKPQQ